MAPPTIAKWTPAIEKMVAKLWNENVETPRILRQVKADLGVTLRAEDIHSLAKRKGAALGMIEGDERRRMPRPERVTNRKIKITKAGKKQVVVESEPVEGTDFMDLKAGHCRYPLTKSLPHKFCSKKAVVGSWCDEHLAIIKGKAKK